MDADELTAAARRLQAEFDALFQKAGALITIGSTGRGVAAEVLWGQKVGKGLYHHAVVMRRRFGPFGLARQTRSVAEAESELRTVLQQWLDNQPWAIAPEHPRFH